MSDDFRELNELVWYQANSLVLDGVIWCLGPYVDESRPYGPSRLALARLTRRLVRRLLGIRD